MARNLSIDEIRSKKYKESQKTVANIDTLYEIVSPEFEKEPETVKIKNFVSKLGINRKEVINLIYFGGFTQKQTSEILKIPLGTVKTRNRLGIEDLKSLIA